MPRLDRRTLAGMVVFTAFVAAATMAFSVYVPATRGYFNVGEIMVYTSAILMGPVVGAFSGGVGSMIADLALGFPYYAPATLVIKGAEGFIVGYLSRRVFGYSKVGWRAFSSAAGVGVGLLVWWVGVNYYAGDVEASVGLPSLGYRVASLHIPVAFWLAIAALAFILIMLAGFSIEPTVGWPVLSVLAGGVVMVAGYFLYQVYLFGVVAALVEVPVNIGQVTVGLLVAIPLTRSVARLLPQPASGPSQRQG